MVEMPLNPGPERYEEHLYRFADARSAILGKVADEIEAQLGPWRGEKGE